MGAPSFLVCARVTTCVRVHNVHVHSLEGILLVIIVPYIEG